MEKIATINHSRHIFRMIIVTVFVVLIGAITYITFKKKLTSQTLNTLAGNGSVTNSETNNAVITPAVFDAKKPWLSITKENASTIVNTNQTSTFIVKGFSEGKNIEGYDILLSINPEQYEVVSIESVQPAFQIYQFNKQNHITITGVKQLSVTSPTVFAETPLLRVVIKPKIKGDINLAIIDSVKKEQTKFVDEKVNVINPQLQSLTVEIK